MCFCGSGTSSSPCYVIPMAQWNGASILVIRLSSLGDIARLLPSLRALRSGPLLGRLDVTVEDRFAPLLELFPFAHRVVVYPRRSSGPFWRHPARWGAAMARYRRSLREIPYDLALDLHGILRSAVVARMSGAAETAGYARGFGKEGSHLLYGRAVSPAPNARISRYERYAGTLRALGLPEPAKDRLEPSISTGVRDEVEGFLDAAGVAAGGYIFAFIGTSKAQAHKRWPPSHFIELARIVRSRSGLPTVLGWGPEEADVIAGLPKEEFLIPIPLWDLPHLVESVRRASAFVGADTGAMHLAALMGVPTVAVLGPTDPVLNAPFGEWSRIVHGEGVVRTCSGQGCDHKGCMASISAERVAEALGEVMSATRGLGD